MKFLERIPQVYHDRGEVWVSPAFVGGFSNKLRFLKYWSLSTSGGRPIATAAIPRLLICMNGLGLVVAPAKILLF